MVFLQFQKSMLQLCDVVIKKTSDGDEAANYYEPKLHGDVSFTDSD